MEVIIANFKLAMSMRKGISKCPYKASSVAAGGA